MKNISQKKHILICTSKSCKKKDSEKLFCKLKSKLKKRDLKSSYRPIKVSCLGKCGKGPNIAIWPDGTLYCGIEKDSLNDLIDKHLVSGKVLKKYLSKKAS